MKLYRYMSVDECNQLVRGETLKHNRSQLDSRHGKYGKRFQFRYRRFRAGKKGLTQVAWNYPC